jgi:hypothetical protein
MYNEITIFSREVAEDVRMNIGSIGWKTTIQGHRFWWNCCYRSRRLGPRDMQWLEGMNRYRSNAPV